MPTNNSLAFDRVSHSLASIVNNKQKMNVFWFLSATLLLCEVYGGSLVDSYGDRRVELTLAACEDSAEENSVSRLYETLDTFKPVTNDETEIIRRTYKVNEIINHSCGPFVMNLTKFNILIISFHFV